MASHRRSIPALERLKNEYLSVLKKHHNPLISAAEKEIDEFSVARAKEIKKEIEEFAKKFPEVTVKLKCEFGASATTSSSITIGLNFSAKVPKATSENVARLKKAADDDRKRLDQWYLNCLSSMAIGDGIPAFDTSGRTSNSTRECAPNGYL